MPRPAALWASILSEMAGCDRGRRSSDWLAILIASSWRPPAIALQPRLIACGSVIGEGACACAVAAGMASSKQRAPDLEVICGTCRGRSSQQQEGQHLPSVSILLPDGANH